MNGKKDWAFSTLLAIALAMAGWSLKWQFKANTQIALMQQTLQQVVSDTEQDIRQDKTLTKFWRIHSWTRDRITELRNVHDLDIAEWPDLDVD